MKVRMGVGFGVGQVFDDVGRYGEAIDVLEDLDFDSVWMSERVTGGGLDPTVALAVAAGRTRRLKLGTNVLILPGRDPFLVARQLATLDRLSDGRLLPAVGLGTPSPADRAPFGVPHGTRAGTFEDDLEILRTLWSDGGSVPHPDGGAPMRVDPKPTRPLEIWFGGRKRRALERAGRLSDGWIGAFQTPEECGAARQVIVDAAAAAGRTVDDDHYGAAVYYARERRSELGELIVRTLSEHYVPELLLPLGADELTAVLHDYVAHGISKFVLVPADQPADWGAELGWLREVTAPLES